MTAAVRRSGGRAVGVAVALLTAGPPLRLSAQTGSLVAVLPGSARAAGMGGAGAAIVGDAAAIFANPAALATVHHLVIEGEYESYPSGVTLSTGALALRAGRFTWGVGAAALGQTYTSADLLGLSSLVLRSGMVALGATAKYARETVGGARVDAWAGDAGLAIAQWPAAGGGSAFLVLGLESGVVTRGMGVLGRIGYVGHSTATTASPFTAGASVELGRLHLDYAYRADDALGARHRMGVRWMP